MKNKSHSKVAFKWSSVDQGLLPALSGVVKTIVLTGQSYELFLKLPNFTTIIFVNQAKLRSLS